MKRPADFEIISVSYPLELTEVEENRECGKENQMLIRGIYWFLPEDLRLLIMRDMTLDVITNNYKNNFFLNLPVEVISHMQDNDRQENVFNVLVTKCSNKHWGNAQDTRFYKHLLWVLRDRVHGARWIRIRRKLEYNQ